MNLLGNVSLFGFSLSYALTACTLKYFLNLNLNISGHNMTGAIMGKRVEDKKGISTPIYEFKNIINFNLLKQKLTNLNCEKIYQAQ